MTKLAIMMALSCCHLCLNGQTFERPDIDSIFGEWSKVGSENPGFVVAIVSADSVYYQESFGYANLEYGIPLSDSSLFDIASVSKQFTGFAIAKLELEGMLSKNDSIKKYFPELQELLEGITIEHLIHHKSGLRDVVELYFIGHFGANLTCAKALEILGRQKSLNFSPNAEYSYSNTNYILLARIVEIVSGINFRDWCHQNIFEPLGMASSFANDNPEEVIPNRVHAYYGEEGDFSFEQNNGMALIGSSAIYSSIADMIKWGQAMLQPSEFSPIFQKMHTASSRLSDGTELKYGYGLYRSSYRNHRLFVHYGASPSGFRSTFAQIPALKLVVVALGNWGNIDLIGQVQRPIFDQLLLPKEADDVFSGNNSQQLSKSLCDKFAGAYISDNEKHVIIEHAERKLTIRIDENQESELTVIDENELMFEERKIWIKFRGETEKGFSEALMYDANRTYIGHLFRLEDRKDGILNLQEYGGTYCSDELDLHWKIIADGNVLTIEDTKNGTITLTPKTSTFFKDDSYLINNVMFKRDKQNRVTGFAVTYGHHLRNLLFDKIAE